MKTEDKSAIDILLQVAEEQTLPFSIDVLILSTRVHHTLLRSGICTIDEVVKMWKVIPTIRNMGDVGVLEITEKLNLWYQQKDKLPLPCIPALPQNNEELIGAWPFPHDDNLVDVPVSNLDLPIRAYNVLIKNNIKTIGQIYTEWQNIVSFNNVGSFTLKQIQEAVVTLQNQVDDQKEINGEISINKGEKNLESASSLHNKKLIKVNVRVLDLSSSAKKLLWDSNLHTIDQLTFAKLNEISSGEDVKHRTVIQIYTAILDWLSQDENRKNAYLEVMNGRGVIAQPEEVDLNDYFNALFIFLNPRYFSIIEFRFGLRTGIKTTLEETARHFGVTRERIRQIESQALEIIRKRVTRMDQSTLVTTIKEKIDYRGGLISESRLIDELQRICINTTYSIEGILELFSKVFESGIELNQDDIKITHLLPLSGWSTSSYDKDQIFQTANKILEILSIAEFPMQWIDLFSALVCEDGLFTLDEHLAHAIALYMSDTQQIQRQMDGGWFIFEKSTRYSRIISVMRQIGQPAHFSEISDRYDELYNDQPLSEHGIHTVLSGRVEFVRVGQGKYGLPEWGLHDDGNVSNAVRRILADHEHPMNLADIINEVLKTWDVQNSAVISAIENDARFYKTEDGKVWLTEIGLTIEKRKKREDESRVDRLFLIIKEEGKATTIQTIVERHNLSFPERPITILAAKSLMYRYTKLFISMGSKEFGLVEWGLKPTLPVSKKDKPVSRVDIPIAKVNKTVLKVDKKNEILDIIRENEHVSFDVLFDLYNQKYSNRPIKKSTLLLCLRKLQGKINKSNKSEYQAADHLINDFQELTSSRE